MAPRPSVPVITLKEVMMGGANRKGHRCAPCGGGSAVLQSLADKAKRFAFLWGVVLVLGATYVTLHTRDAYFERGRGVLVGSSRARRVPSGHRHGVPTGRRPDTAHFAPRTRRSRCSLHRGSGRQQVAT